MTSLPLVLKKTVLLPGYTDVTGTVELSVALHVPEDTILEHYVHSPQVKALFIKALEDASHMVARSVEAVHRERG